MNEILKTLQPEKIWYYFGEILRIPRPSKKEAKIQAYLVHFGHQHNLETLTDKTGNVLIRKRATLGMENRIPLILQSHMDMVCEKNASSTHSFETDPIEVHIENAWLKAKETTLGADNGIGVAAELAILDSDNIEHGPIECLFTVDEETGLTGAFGLDSNFLKGKILLNLDSEDDGQFFIGCAGGIDTLIEIPMPLLPCPTLGYKAYHLFISGLQGGHSGDDINKGLGNANKFLIRFLCEFGEELGLRIADIHGGNLRNAIAREAYVTLVLEEKKAALLQEKVKKYETVLQREFKTTEPHLKCNLEEIPLPEKLFAPSRQQSFIYAVYACPHGVLRMSADIPNFVETSTNLASLHFQVDASTGEASIHVCTSQRSSVSSAKYAAAGRIAACFKLIGSDVKIQHSDGYPGWAPNPASPILKICTDTFRELFKAEPLSLAIHAGLECGLFEEKYPDLDMVSYGPTMRGVHSPDERLEISTVERFWKLTIEILKRIPQKIEA